MPRISGLALASPISFRPFATTSGGILTVSSLTRAVAEFDGTCLSLPRLVGAGGIMAEFRPDLSDAEREALMSSKQILLEAVNELSLEARSSVQPATHLQCKAKVGPEWRSCWRGMVGRSASSVRFSRRGRISVDSLVHGLFAMNQGKSRLVGINNLRPQRCHPSLPQRK